MYSPRRDGSSNIHNVCVYGELTKKSLNYHQIPPCSSVWTIKKWILIFCNLQHKIPQWTLKQKICTFSFFLLLIILSKPLKAPDAMNRMFVVSTCITSPFNFREFLSGTLTMVPSNILRNPCCTPSPPTSLSWWIPGTLPILSTSSKKIIPKTEKK